MRSKRYVTGTIPHQSTTRRHVLACLSVVVMELQLVRNELHRQNDEGRVSNTLNYGS